MDILIDTLRVQIARLTWRSLLQAGPGLSSSRKQQCPQTDLSKEQSLLRHRILHQNG
jgi:hypothetical protein